MNFKNLAWSASIVAISSLIIASYTQAQDEPKKHDYVGTKQCKMCHNKPDEGHQYTIWKAAKHSRAYTALLGDRAKEIAKSKGLEVPPNESADCLKCHVTAYDTKTKSFPRMIKKFDGIQCESCHGPASSHLIDGKNLRMKKDTSINVLDNLIRPDSKTCIQCHNDQNPTWDPEKYTLKDGTKSGFSFEEAVKTIQHNNPKKTK